MAKITIDGKKIEVENGIPLIQACEIAGVEIPRFCYHDRLRIAGNCRMCLVEVEKSPKPVASCAMPVSDGMIVHTNTPNVKKAREGVMEFLLINHPLDCPICDQGGECDLQDQAFKYGKGSNRFHENKRTVKNKYMGPLVQTHMTRCIQCTRCIRFMNDIAGVPEMGAVHRGEHMEIITYLEKSLSSEISANVIDVCPVGALNAKPGSYTYRKWELKNTDSIDVFDAMGCNIRVGTRGLEVMRILPKLNEDVNEEWISDRVRFSCDGLKVQRIDTPYIRTGDKLTSSSWEDALNLLASKVKATKATKIGAIAGEMVDAETLYGFKSLMDKLGSSNYDYNQHGYSFDVSERGNYLFNSGFAGLESSDLVLVVGANIRKNAPVLAARISKLSKFNDLKIANIGKKFDQSFPVIELGDDIKLLSQIEKGTHKFNEMLKNAKNPLMIIGDGIYSREDSLSLQKQLISIANKHGFIKDGWNGYNVLHNHSSIVAALDLDFIATDEDFTAKKMAKKVGAGSIELLFLLGADEVEISSKHKGFVVYVGHHGDKNAQYADIVLPSAAFTEKDATHVNNEGRIQFANLAVLPPYKAKADYEIVMLLAKKLNIDLGYDNLKDLRAHLRAKLHAFMPNQYKVSISTKIKISDDPISHIKANYYLSNSISRASKTMSECYREIGSKDANI